MRSEGRGTPPLGIAPMADGGGGIAAVGALSEKEGCRGPGEFSALAGLTLISSLFTWSITNANYESSGKDR